MQPIFALLAGLSAIIVLPVAAADNPQRNVTTMTGDTVITHIADGGGWRTTITLINLDLKPVTYRLHFYGDDGTPKVFNVPGIGSDGVLIGGIPVGGSVTIATAGGGLETPLATGWAELDTADQIGGMAIFQALWVDQEAVVPISNAYGTHMMMPFDTTQPSQDSNPFASSYALVNPSSYATAVVSIEIRDEAGNRLGTDQFTLAPREHRAFALTDRYYKETVRKRGVVEVSTTGTGLAALGLRFNPRGAFTSFHASSVIGR